jgi:hypothetical protein
MPRLAELNLTRVTLSEQQLEQVLYLPSLRRLGLGCSSPEEMAKSLARGWGDPKEAVRRAAVRARFPHVDICRV